MDNNYRPQKTVIGLHFPFNEQGVFSGGCVCGEGGGGDCPGVLVLIRHVAHQIALYAMYLIL